MIRRIPAKARIKAPDTLPAFVVPELATLRRAPPSGPDWVHEVKLDGYRLQARIDSGHVQLFTRSGLDWTARFPQLVGELAAWKVTSALIDGEAVVRNSDGTTDFAGLVTALKNGYTDGIDYFAFDILFVDGADLRAFPLQLRKSALAELMLRQTRQRIHLLESLTGHGPLLFEAACQMGLEGIVSKNLTRPYRSGRQRSWIKTKCQTSDDFAIIGYEPSKADAGAVGALLLASRTGRKLSYAGRAETGFTARTAHDLRRRLDALAGPCPVALPREIETAGVIWTKPTLIARVHFREKTPDGLLRHAVFKGLREDA